MRRLNMQVLADVDEQQLSLRSKRELSNVGIA
jgi:hypothetical protein